MHRAGQLTAGKLQEFAAAGRFGEMVAALSVMSNVPTAIIERNMLDSQAEALLVFAEAIGLSWETTRSIMVLAAKRHRRVPPPAPVRCGANPRLSPYVEPHG